MSDTVAQKVIVALGPKVPRGSAQGAYYATQAPTVAADGFPDMRCGCQYPPRGELKFVLNTGLPNTFHRPNDLLNDLVSRATQGSLQFRLKTCHLEKKLFSVGTVPRKMIIFRLSIRGNISSWNWALMEWAKCLFVI